MSILKSLSRQVKKMAEQVGPPEPEPFKFRFAMALFRAEEQERLQRFLAQVEPKYHYIRDHLEFDRLTDEELGELGQWIYLQDALERQDTATAAKYRHRLTISLEALVAQFLAIDEDALPDHDHAPAVTDRYGIEKRLSATQFRSDRRSVEYDREHGRLSRSARETMHIWLEHLPPTSQ